MRRPRRFPLALALLGLVCLALSTQAASDHTDWDHVKRIWSTLSAEQKAAYEALLAQLADLVRHLEDGRTDHRLRHVREAAARGLLAAVGGTADDVPGHGHAAYSTSAARSPPGPSRSR